jgi:hypothetical protein
MKPWPCNTCNTSERYGVVKCCKGKSNVCNAVQHLQYLQHLSLRARIKQLEGNYCCASRTSTGPRKTHGLSEREKGVAGTAGVAATWDGDPALTTGKHRYRRQIP